MGVALGTVPDANWRAATPRRIFRPHEAARFWYNTRRSVEGGVGWRGGAAAGEEAQGGSIVRELNRASSYFV